MVGALAAKQPIWKTAGAKILRERDPHFSFDGAAVPNLLSLPLSGLLSLTRSRAPCEPFLILSKSFMPSGWAQVSGSPGDFLSDCAELQGLHLTVVILAFYFWKFNEDIFIIVYISYTCVYIE